MNKFIASVHNHSTYCDGKHTLRQMAEKACELGLKTLGMSGHAAMATDMSYCMTKEGSIAYAKELLELKAEFAPKLEILLGIEWDFLCDNDVFGVSQRVFPDFDAIQKSGFALDYWVGSVHYLQEQDKMPYPVDNTAQDMQNGIDELYNGEAYLAVEAYFANVAKMAQMKPTVLGHFDLIKKLNKPCKIATDEQNIADDKKSPYIFFDETAPRYVSAALNALKVARENDCLIEINTGAVSRGYRDDFYPSDFLLAEWQKMGGKITITADAHSAENLCFGFEQAAECAKKAGFTHQYVVHTGGRLEMVKL